MRLRTYRLQGFRSVRDSGVCYLASDVTVLAGKNESGKSSILDAMSTLITTEVPEITTADRTTGSNTRLVLHTVFELEAEDIQVICKDLGIDYFSERELIIEWDEENVTVTGRAFQEIQTGMERAIEHSELELGDECFRALRELGVDTIPTETRPAAALVREKLRTPATASSDPRYAKLMGEVETYLRRCELYDGLNIYVGDQVPPVVVFRSFEDELPDSIAIDDEDDVSKVIVQNFCKLAGLDLPKLLDKSLTLHDRRHLVEQATDIYSGQFGRYWNQEELKLGVEIDGTNLVFVVKSPDETYSYAPSQRSKGFKWYLSFFITLTARKAQAGKSIILIDEPGLYLHPKAQSDLLAVLEDMAKAGSQVIIATHSPYLIRPDRLDRVRLVVKGRDKKTTIHNSWYGGADKDSITPLVTALGLDMARHYPTMSRYNVIVEGPTDYYYLQAMRSVLEKLESPLLPSDLVFVPAMGHANVGLLLSLFIGWNLPCVVVLDKKGTRSTQTLLTQQGFPEQQILRLGAEDGDSTLDLFTVNDAAKYIFPSDMKVSPQKLSVQGKRVEGVSEVILARRFFDRVLAGEQMTFEPDTLDRFRRVFVAIGHGLGLGGSGNAGKSASGL